MTKAEWLTSTDPDALLTFVLGRVPVRKIRLFGCGCCRLMWNDNWPLQCRRAVEVAEQFADGQVSEQELQRVRSRACQVASSASVSGRRLHFSHAKEEAASWLHFTADTALPDGQVEYRTHVKIRYASFTRQAVVPLIHCLFGNTYRPVSFATAWRTSDALALAETIYADRLFDRLPILADALEEAGCDNADLLAHCRSDGPHARGCWAVDAVLGKG